jgi:hypothetical protein
MAQFYLALSAWFDNLGEQAQFIKTPNPALAVAAAAAEAAAAPASLQQQQQQLPSGNGVGAGSRNRFGSGVIGPDGFEWPIPTPEAWGSWSELYGSGPFLEKWRRLQFNWEVAVFLPAVGAAKTFGLTHIFLLLFLAIVLF